MIDTHCHLNIMVDKKPEELLTKEQLVACSDFIKNAHNSGVHTLICVGTSLPESLNCILIARQYPSVRATIGVHPCDITMPVAELITGLEELLAKHRQYIVAIGEIGLDYYHQPFDAALQAEVFRAQLDLAVRHALPVVIHIRDAGGDALGILREYKEKLRGVIHCFSLDEAAAREVISWGWYIGIDGPITYPKNSALRALVAAVPLEGLLLETDAPFLPPQPLRGKRNSPSTLGIIAEAISEARGITVEAVRIQTTKNAQRLFTLLECAV